MENKSLIIFQNACIHMYSMCGRSGFATLWGPNRLTKIVKPNIFDLSHKVNTFLKTELLKIENVIIKNKFI